MTDPRLGTAARVDEDAQYEAGLRPRRLDEYIGQDRIRENLRKYKSMPLRQLIDLSINETLNRTINTSFTTFLATLPLALVASGAVQEFAIVILFGIVIGTSSSIFIAAPILIYLGVGTTRADTPDTPAKK